jgi:hypothetical protein
MLGRLEKYLQGIHGSVPGQKCNKELSNEIHGAESLLERLIVAQLIKNFLPFYVTLIIVFTAGLY